MAEQIRRIERVVLRYPWEQWTDGRAWRAKRGADFQCSAAAFRNRLYERARLEKKRVETSVQGDIVEFQFFTRPALPPRPSGAQSPTDGQVAAGGSPEPPR
jgi:hypothetical protein